MKSLKLLLLLRTSTVLSCLFNLIILGGLAGCSEFIVSICEIDSKKQGCFSDSGMAEDRPKDMEALDMPPSPMPLRKFEWRAKVEILQILNFVGIDRRQSAIFLVNGSPIRFSALMFRFDRPANMPQLDPIECMGCPKLVDNNSVSDAIFLTGEADREFWLLRYGTTMKSFQLKADGSMMKMDDDIDQNRRIRPFFHPVLNASSIAVNTMGRDGSSLVARLPKSGGTTKYTIEHPKIILAQAIGDLDSIDPRKNGLDIINIGSNSIESVLHYDTETNNEFSDDTLRGRIADAVGKTKRSDSELLEAAYIENLNNDKYVDFIYSWCGRIHAASYTGNWTDTGGPLLQDWGKEVVIVPDGEKIKSIMALDLTADRFPELIVETDKAVHFYLNTP